MNRKPTFLPWPLERPAYGLWKAIDKYEKQRISQGPCVLQQPMMGYVNCGAAEYFLIMRMPRQSGMLSCSACFCSHLLWLVLCSLLTLQTPNPTPFCGRALELDSRLWPATRSVSNLAGPARECSHNFRLCAPNFSIASIDCNPYLFQSLWLSCRRKVKNLRGSMNVLWALWG